MEKDHQLYRAVDVWKRISPELAICYHCFEVLSPYEEERGFCVQSADHYYEADGTKSVELFQRQFLELLFEEKPDKRSKVHKSLEDAVLAFRRDFADW